MKLVFYIIAALIGFLGLMFVVGNQGQVIRVVVGILLFVGAIALVYMSRVQPRSVERTTIQKLDLSGDVSLEEFRCRSCNAPLSKEEISVEAGAILIQCEHCGSTYQVEEEPKW